MCGGITMARVLSRISRLVSVIDQRLSEFQRQRNIDHYIKSGRRPWSKGYHEFKLEFIHQVLRNEEIMAAFRNSLSLPEGYGVRLDDRVVEYPWVLSRISNGPGHICDAGSTLNFSEIIDYPKLRDKSIDIITLAPESNCFWHMGISYILSDLRSIRIHDDYYDEIVCISTIEHIGMDNIMYTHDSVYSENESLDFCKVCLELKRVLKPGGKLYITVPFGRYQNFGWFQQFDIHLVDLIAETFQPSEASSCYYKYTQSGWNISDQLSCSESEYFDVRSTKYFDPDSATDYDKDFAAASRAVTCLEFKK